ncbi:MAG: hypothetical protein GY757_38300, partial [bacterium]|nr:hypothetical protein [bacterium]
VIYGNKYDCPPYLKGIEFTIEYSSNFMNLPDTITITQPGGQNVPYPYFRSHKTFAKVKIDYPSGGIWRFDRKKNIKLMVDEKKRPAQYVAPVSPVGVGTSMKLQFKIHGNGPGDIFKPLPNHPLEGLIKISTPDNGEDILNAAAETAQPEIYASTVPYKFAKQGKYRVRFTGTVVTPSGRKARVVESESKEITVINTRPVKVHLEEPGVLASLFGTVTGELNIAFQAQNQEIAIETILKSKPKIEAEMVINDGPDALSGIKTIPLTYENGRLAGEIEAEIPWRFYPRLLLGQLIGTITLKMDNRLLKDGYFLEDPGTSSQLYQFELKVRESLWLYLLLFLLLPLLLFGVYLLLFKMKGTGTSKEVPLLMYRHGNLFSPDTTVEEKITVFKKKMVFKDLKKRFS